MSPISNIRLWQLISPALPVGAYSYSQGLEYAVERQWVYSEDTAYQWVNGLLTGSLAHLDVPVFQRLYLAIAADDNEKLRYWNRFLIAARETHELRAEDRQMGAALATLLTDLDIKQAAEWKQSDVCFAAMFALAAGHWQVDVKQAAQGLLWAWCENQVMAAMKLVPLGQTAGQRLLLKLSEQIPKAVEQGFGLEDEAIGWVAPGLVMGSMLHEVQYTRLFRS